MMRMGKSTKTKSIHLDSKQALSHEGIKNDFAKSVKPLKTTIKFYT